MRYLVCIKQTPDTAELPKITSEEAASGKLGVNLVVNPWDELAIEAGLKLMETFGGTTGAIAVGDEGVIDALRSALAMGCKDATLVKNTDADALGVAELLAAAVKQDDEVDVVVTGQMTVDGNSGSLPVLLGRKLGWPVLTGVAKIIDLTNDSITVERSAGQARLTVKTSLPVVVSVNKEIGEPRYPTFINIRKAARVNVPTLTAEDLGVKMLAPVMHMTNFRKPPSRDAKVQLFKGAPQEAAAALVDALLAEKVL